MTQRLLWLMVLLLPLSLCLSAQAQKTVTGTVKTETGEPVAGATVTAENSSGKSKSTVTTDSEGVFTFSGLANGRYTFTISSVGYATESVNGTVGNNGLQLSVTLKIAAQSLEDVVVVGYGTQRKRDVTGAVKSVKAESFNKGIVNNPQQLLQGKVAGVNITTTSGEPGAGVNIVIRGSGTVRSGSSPLFVIDGVPLDNAGTGSSDPLSFLNPQDIASMDVLKDASATAIYGSRGANGVVIVTTKKGRAGTSTLNYSSSIGIASPAHKLPIFSTDEFKKQVTAVGGDLEDFGASTDWQNEIFRTANTYDNNLTLSGGSNKLVYYASVNALSQNGILKGSNFKKYTGRFNATQKLWDDRLSIDINLTATNTNTLRPNIDGMIGSAISNNPTLPARDADGNPAKFQNVSNPLLELELYKDQAAVNRVLGNITPTLKIIKGLTYKLNFGIDNATGSRDYVNRANEVPHRDGRFENQTTLVRNRIIENYLTYTTDIDKHNFTALAGHSYQNILYQFRGWSINKLPLNDLDPVYNPGIGQELTLANDQNRPYGNANINEIQSYFARINYAFDNKYLVTVNFRMDGSTKFGENNKYGYFPSFSLGWNIAEEEFMKNSAFSVLKLRGGWGITGNQEIGPKLTQPLFRTEVNASVSYPLYPTGAYPPGTFYSRLANPDLKWEQSKTTNVGLDFGLLNGDLTGSIDVFEKISDNILLSIPPQDPVQPSALYYANIPGMIIKNSGIELDLTYRKKLSRNLSIGVGGNAAFIKNRVSGSPYQVIYSGYATGSGLTSATINGYVNGQPIGTFYMLDFIGINEDGTSKYADTDKDGIITPKDRIAAGSAVPKSVYGFWGNVSYRGFDLSVNFNGVSGNKIYDNTATANFYKAKIFKSGNTTSEAVQYPTESVTNAASISTRYLKDGTYFRLNNMVLAYNFNTEKLGVRKWVSSLRLSVTAQNLFVITKYDGYDPEINADRNIDGALSYGIDYLNYPKARSVIFGLNLSF